MLKLFAKLRKRERLLAAVCLLLVLGQCWFDLTLPDYMKELTLLIQTPGSTPGEVWQVGVKMLGCALGSALLAVACGWSSAQVAAGFGYSLREAVFGKVADLGKAEMDRFSVPSLITRTTNDVNQIQMLISLGLQVLVRAPIMAVWAVIKITGKSWELSAVTGLVVVFLLTVMLMVLAILLPRFKRVQKLTDDLNRIARENLAGIHVVHAFNAEDYQQEKFRKANDALTGIQLFNQRTFAGVMPLMQMAMNGLSLTIYWLGAVLIQAIPAADMAGRMNLLGDVVTFSTYATHVIMSLMMIGMIFMFLPAAQVSAGRIREVLDTDLSVKPGTVSESGERGTVEFRNVSFRYPDGGHDVLENISFRAEKGQTVAIIGATGCGKSTLTGLAARFYDPTQGQVFIDGVDVREYTFDALYDKLGYVPQKALLFSGSVRANVSFGESAAANSESDLWESVELAQASDFVSALPGGLHGQIAQSGRNLSGGQKQRLSIARALARKPEILIFDDSFSALDYQTDAALRGELKARLGDTTVLMVAQRIGTIKDADCILVLEHGKLVGQGTHRELLQSCDVYREIACSQLSPEELEV